MWRAMIVLILAYGTAGSRITTNCIVGKEECEDASSFISLGEITMCCKNGTYASYYSSNIEADTDHCLCVYGDGISGGFIIDNGVARPMTESERKEFESRMQKMSTELNSRMKNLTEEMDKWSKNFNEEMNKWSEKLKEEMNKWPENFNF